MKIAVKSSHRIAKTNIQIVTVKLIEGKTILPGDTMVSVSDASLSFKVTSLTMDTHNHLRGTFDLLIDPIAGTLNGYDGKDFVKQ